VNPSADDVEVVVAEGELKLVEDHPTTGGKYGTVRGLVENVS
jgi:hypothetical protein